MPRLRVFRSRGQPFRRPSARLPLGMAAGLTPLHDGRAPEDDAPTCGPPGHCRRQYNAKNGRAVPLGEFPPTLDGFAAYSVYAPIADGAGAGARVA